MAKQTTQPSSDKQKASKNTALLRPGIVALAVTFYWAATHQTAGFDVFSTCIWVTGSVVAGLVAYATIAVLVPAISILAAYGRRTGQQIHRSILNEASGG